MERPIYVFDCPLHGLEIQALCYRAFNKEYKKNITKRIETNDGE